MKNFFLDIKKDNIASNFEKFETNIVAVSYFNARSNGRTVSEVLSNYKLVFMLKGSAKVTIEGAEYTLFAGDVALVQPPSFYYVDILGEEKCEFATIFFNFESKTYEKNFKAMFTDKTIIIANKLIPENMIESTPIAIFEAKNLEWGHYYKLKLLLSRMLFLLYAYLINHPEITENVANAPTTKEELTSQCVQYIITNLHLPLEVNELCEKFNVSQSYLHKCFKKVFNCSTKEYITMQKLKYAQSQLLTTDKNLSIIANEIGYTNCYQFSNVFKNKYGLSPGKYRKENSN